MGPQEEVAEVVVNSAAELQLSQLLASPVEPVRPAAEDLLDEKVARWDQQAQSDLNL